MAYMYSNLRICLMENKKMEIMIISHSQTHDYVFSH